MLSQLLKIGLTEEEANVYLAAWKLTAPRLQYRQKGRRASRQLLPYVENLLAKKLLSQYNQKME